MRPPRLRPLYVNSFLLLALLAVSLASLLAGPYKGVGLGDLVSLLTGEGPGSGVLEYRLVRTAALIVLGAGLASAGATLQYLTRNPLVDPYLVGVSSGAMLGVLASYLLGVFSPYTVYLFALAGGIAGYSIVALASSLAGLSGHAFIVAGVAFSYLYYGVGILAIVMGRLDDELPPLLLWLFGTVAYATLGEVARASTLVALSVGASLLYRKAVNTLILGEEESKALGVNVARLRLLLVTASSLSVASLVAMAGPVGFIGLTAPWIARMWVGSEYGSLLASSILTGALIAVTADVALRIIVAPSEAPLTAVTAVLGAPVLVYVSHASRRV